MSRALLGFPAQHGVYSSPNDAIPVVLILEIYHHRFKRTLFFEASLVPFTSLPVAHFACRLLQVLYNAQ